MQKRSSSMPVLLLILIGLIGGFAVGVQGPMSGVMSQQLGAFSSSLIIHISGALASALILVFLGGEKIAEWRNLPAPYFFTGVLGVVLYMTLSVTLPRLGAGGTVALLVAGQMVVALVVDQFGWFGVPQNSISLVRVAGAALLVAGAYLISLSPSSA
ncbi:MAG: DMT family transporter [Anaerolineae bacterium]|nr:DMT family transporter [Anaerolineae bacterium]MCA9892643.1 DMT family transporter [Anaerolineae bacterium]